MNPVASIGAAPARGVPSTDPMTAPAERQTPLERLLAEPGPLKRFTAPEPAARLADAEHGAAPLR